MTSFRMLMSDEALLLPSHNHGIHTRLKRENIRIKSLEKNTNSRIYNCRFYTR